ncbi:GP16 [Buzura suppressaria nucleopolyhedrovirus]|uniref:GP16 n=1 Tax=Buzura suppressaria nuclear polyhedrosis virus TaxID=74320 RepID=W5VSD7_NPVBS|nr:GP16 [Buzura suppressaria nucleopolyhedrovirus]AHH82697.1 GP16 [Buzura suppressaria nucleopolyhedrovirus]QYF10577.1 gp16 [Buzura suppressaria nucleopolyhedrovirus]
MNYSAVALILLVAYMWHAGSLMREIYAIKELLVAIYEMIENKFYSLSEDLASFKNQSVVMLELLHNNTRHTIDLVVNNSQKLDMVNTKIDVILNRPQI